MRTINECKAEIFRRGNEKKAKKAKQRKFLLSLVLPTFVSLTIICSLPLLIYPPSDEKGDPGATGTLDGGANVGSITDFPYTSAEIAGGEKCFPYGKKILTDDDVKNAYYAINRVMDENDSIHFIPEQAPSEEEKYTITFIGYSVEEKFTLNGSYLIYNEEAYILSSEELVLLKQALKIE
ncbi:MAG: hypothetical protein IJF11_05445 [Clostridia bacterium]|nr:hypothetical protein [Clostridia bacterium]